MAKPAGNIVIKKIKKSAAGHHGGAWKVAYADFVTAMMAFFLLMWLLNATEAENLAGLADYFAPTVGVKDEMGIGFRGGKSALSDGIGADRNTNKGIVFGGVPAGPITKVTEKIEETTNEPDKEQIKVLIDNRESKQKSDEGEAVVESEDTSADEQFAETQQALESSVQDMVKNRRADEGAIEVKKVPEGLLIEIKDVDGNSMFEDNSSAMKEKLKQALYDLSKILVNVPNNLTLTGHTSSVIVQSKIPGYTKWELSSDRANATRNFLEKSGIQKERISKIEGRADNLPFDRRRPESPVNNRINITLLKNNDTPNHKKSTPDSIFLDSKGSGSQLQDLLQQQENKTEDAPKKDNEPSKNSAIENLIKESTSIPKEVKK